MKALIFLCNALGIIFYGKNIKYSPHPSINIFFTCYFDQFLVCHNPFSHFFDAPFHYFCFHIRD